MKIKTANVTNFGKFAPGVEQRDWYGGFQFRQIDFSGVSDEFLKYLVAGGGRTYLDRNAARGEPAGRAMHEWKVWNKKTGGGGGGRLWPVPPPP